MSQWTCCRFEALELYPVVIVDLLSQGSMKRKNSMQDWSCRCDYRKANQQGDARNNFFKITTVELEYCIRL